MKIINFAIIGLGRIGSIHLENMIDNENINVECISDTNTTKLNFFKKKYNLNVCENINRDIFQNKNIDAILIATPTSSHLQLILKAIHHEKFIFCAGVCLGNLEPLILYANLIKLRFRRWRLQT